MMSDLPPATISFPQLLAQAVIVGLLSKLFVAGSLYPSIYDFTALVDLGRFFSFLICTQSVGLPGWGIIPSQGHYLTYTEQHQQRINIHALSGVQTHNPSV
jgi:hypothetical protein